MKVSLKLDKIQPQEGSFKLAILVHFFNLISNFSQQLIHELLSFPPMQ